MKKLTLSQKYRELRNRSLASLTNKNPGTLLDKGSFDLQYIIQVASTFGYLTALEELDSVLLYLDITDTKNIIEYINKYMESKLLGNVNFVIPFAIERK